MTADARLLAEQDVHRDQFVRGARREAVRAGQVDEFRGAPNRVNSGLTDRAYPLDLDGKPMNTQAPQEPEKQAGEEPKKEATDGKAGGEDKGKKDDKKGGDKPAGKK